MTTENIFADAPIIYSYTREDALDDGTLVDVSGPATESGIKYPVAMTRTCWDTWVAVPKGLEGWQDAEGRLWDTLWMLRVAISQQRGACDTIRYTVIFQMPTGRGAKKPYKQVYADLKAICGPGDRGEPVITIMLPEED
ncbi:DUF6573 family protein [Oceanidesulfovibrio marinus]|uniref:Uncharacterized protein n=1 Tax=Oceanidesulfovibrio marinus TaxID=370038 RepID=A0A6P1ZEY0_9BACT|nr:DUF6573 family protein [Oceanidesulfovibrio marinus]TVM31189.1 hypothetical protein DQK91_18945 [Oceanidesulfovibrio marinus]